MSRRIPEQKTAIYRRPRRQPPPPDFHLPVPEPDRARRARNRRRRWPWFLLGFSLIFGLIVGSATVAGYLYQRNRIMPGVHTLGVRLGGQRVEEATIALSQNWDAREIRLDGGDGRRYTLRPATLGIALDAEATALAAYRQGRSIPDIEAAVRHAFSGSGFEPTWAFDPVAARAALAEVSDRISVAPADAGIRYANGRVDTTPPASGRQLDVDATVSWLRDNVGLVVLSGRLPLVIHTVPPAIADSSAVAAQLNDRLSRELTIHAFDPVRDETYDLAVPPQSWTAWITVETGTTAPQTVGWKVDLTQVEAYLAAQADTFGTDRYLDLATGAATLAQAVETGEQVARVRIYHRDRTHVVRPGETLSSIAYEVGIPYPWIEEANPGSGDGLRPGQTITVPSPDLLLPLPIVRDKRIVVSLSRQRMWAYENGAVRWEWPVSTGIESSPTAPGVFQVQSHEPNAYAGNWDLWMPNFMGIYRPVPTSDFMNGFHGFPTRNGANLLWTDSLGRRVTYGCILISNDNAPLLFDWAEEGVVVEVRP